MAEMEDAETNSYTEDSCWLGTVPIELGMMIVSGIAYSAHCVRVAKERITGKARKLRTLGMGAIKAFGRDIEY